MKSVGIKQLKARLSEYVRLARGGEVILVTDRDEVVAELSAPRRRATRGGKVEETLDQLAQTGSLERSGADKAGWSWRVEGLGLAEGTAAAVLDELRGDRDRASTSDPE